MDRDDIIKAYYNFYRRGQRGLYLAFHKNPDGVMETFALVDSNDTRLALYKSQKGAVRELRGVEHIVEWYKS